MEKERKKSWTNILLYGGLALVIAFAVITGIVVNFQKRKLNDLDDKNNQIEDVLGEEENAMFVKNFSTFSKNLLNFIDKR
ncbi:MAG: hypothetical protein J6C53_03140 [Clostridia bacterium]|nr:hypothetical protein [Clostridia bacterium]